MDEVVVSIAGEQHWLSRAVDQDGFVLDVVVQRRRDSRAAQRLIRKLLKSAITPPRVMITDKLRSYGAARPKMGLRVEHRQHKGLNNRAETSHQPTATRRIMKRFKSALQAQRFLSVHVIRTSSTSSTLNSPLPTSAALCESEPLRFGPSLHYGAIADPASQKNRPSSPRRFLKLTMPANLFHIPYLESPLLTSAALRESEPLRFGPRYPLQAPSPDPASQKIRPSSPRRFLKLTMPAPRLRSIACSAPNFLAMRVRHSVRCPPKQRRADLQPLKGVTTRANLTTVAGEADHS